MKITQNPITVSGSVTVRTRINKLLFNVSKALGGLTVSDSIITDLAAATIEVLKNTTAGAETKIYKQNLLNLLEIATLNDGSVKAGISGATIALRGTVEFCPAGAEHLTGNDFYTVNIAGLAAGLSVNIFAVDSPFDALQQFAYEPARVNADSVTDVNLVGAELLAIPVSMLSALEFNFNNGARVIYTPEEVAEMCAELNPVAFVIDGKLTSGAYNLYVIKVGGVAYARVTSSSDGNIYKVTARQLR